MKEYVLLALLILFGALSSSYDYEERRFKPVTSVFKADQEPGELSIATFNAEVLGPTKASNESRIRSIVSYMVTGDVTAVQELRDRTNQTVNTINQLLPEDYEVLISPRLGRTQSKEQYLFAYNATKLNVSNPRVIDDPEDVYEREPFIATFTAQNFTFTLINIHIKPDDAGPEINNMFEDFVPTTNTSFIIAGDLNADCRYYDESEKPYRDYWFTPDEADTTSSDTDCAYDRVIGSQHTVDNYRTHHILPVPRTASDHNYVYATFTTAYP